MILIRRLFAAALLWRTGVPSSFDLPKLDQHDYFSNSLLTRTARYERFVRIDDTLNPAEARESGVMTAQIGVAPALPLEFLRVRLVVEGNTARVAEEAP